jgi:hypothetical protein
MNHRDTEKRRRKILRNPERQENKAAAPLSFLVSWVP